MSLSFHHCAASVPRLPTASPGRSAILESLSHDADPRVCIALDKPMRSLTIRFVTAATTVVALFGSISLAAAPPGAVQSGLPVDATGEQIFEAACITCHGPDGTGGDVTFETEPPDFTDCAFATGEADLDWYAVVHEGGTIRGLDHRMPAFGDALTERQIVAVVDYLRRFCGEPSWPRGDLNLPRAFFTEKAYPENEAVWTIGLAGGEDKSVGNEFVYERRVGTRNQIEAVVPFDAFSGQSAGDWTRGIGDIALAFKRTLHASLPRGTIAAAGAEVIMPTGNADRDLGKGTAVVEPFAMWGLLLPRNAFLQMHGGIELPADTDRASREVYLRTALGTSIMQDRGFGRAWSPQVEILWARPSGGTSEWDVVPQVQITLSKLQHVMMAAGARIPLNERDERSTQVLVYMLWDWYDGSMFDFWK